MAKSFSADVNQRLRICFTLMGDKRILWELIPRNSRSIAALRGDPVTDAKPMPHKVDRNPALQISPLPRETNSANGGVFGKKNRLLPRIIWIGSAAVLADGGSCRTFHLRPYVDVFKPFDHVFSFFLSAMGMYRTGCARPALQEGAKHRRSELRCEYCVSYK